MKTLFIILSTFCASVFAATGDDSDICKDLERAAKSIMNLRQNGTQMSKQMDIAKGSPILEKMVIAAYELPRYSTDAAKQQASTDFSNNIYLSCVKGSK